MDGFHETWQLIIFHNHDLVGWLLTVSNQSNYIAGMKIVKRDEWNINFIIPRERRISQFAA